MFFRAAKRGNEKFVLELISLGADISVANHIGQTLLMIAAECGLHRIVKLCLEKGTESYINRFDETQRNAAMYACENHQTACLEEILKSGKCNPNSVEESGCCVSPTISDISFALTYSSTRMNSKGRDILFLAESSGYSLQAIIDEIVEGKVKTDIWATNAKGQNLLMIAARKRFGKCS